ncbi:MAG: ACP S-malonyltransferase, partial [Brachybacterium tyrofermentans]
GVEQMLAPLSEAGGVDLLRHGTESDADTLRDTAVAQPLLVAAGIVAAAQLNADGDLPGADVIAGHSVGELTAAALAGVLSDEDAMRLVAVRSRAMATAAAAEPTGMAAVVGGSRDEVLAAIERHGLHPANINSAAQIVAAGSLDAIAALREDGPAKARVIPLQVAGAFHTPFMAGAREELTAFTPSLSPTDPTVPLVSNASGEVVTEGSRYLDLIVTQVASPVDWEACMATLRDRGVTAMIEVAPAGTLTGLAKRDLKGIALADLNTPDDLDAARALVREHAGIVPTADQEN